MIELVITLSLFGLLVSLVIPTFTRFGEYVEKELFLKLLASDLAYAQAQAISYEDEIRMVFQTKTGWVTIMNKDKKLRRLKIPYHFQIHTNFPNNQLVFHSSGRSVGGTIRLTNGQREIGKLVVQVASGIPRIELVPR